MACHRSRKTLRDDHVCSVSIRLRSIRGESVTKQRRSHRPCPQRGTAVWCERDGDRWSSLFAFGAAPLSIRVNVVGDARAAEERGEVSAGEVFSRRSRNLPRCGRPVCAIERPTSWTRSVPIKGCSRAAPDGRSCAWRFVVKVWCRTELDAVRGLAESFWDVVSAQRGCGWVVLVDAGSGQRRAGGAV